jgi:hypothetical protein
MKPAVWLCAGVVLLGCGGAASTSPGGNSSSPAPGFTSATAGAWRTAVGDNGTILIRR